MRLVGSIGVVAAALFLSMCSTAPKSQTAVVTDSELEQSIKNRLKENAALREADLSVDADVSDNKVVLKGTVSTESLRTEAVSIAKASRPGVVVEDKIDVKPKEVQLSDYTESMAREARENGRAAGDKIGDSLEDAWIHTKIVTKLMADADTPAHRINVDVVKNVVTLRGSVKTTDARSEANRIASETSGVSRVHNLLKIAKS